MGEIRFVGTGKARGYPYTACKKDFSIPRQHKKTQIHLNKMDLDFFL